MATEGHGDDQDSSRFFFFFFSIIVTDSISSLNYFVWNIYPAHKNHLSVIVFFLSLSLSFLLALCLKEGNAFYDAVGGYAGSTYIPTGRRGTRSLWILLFFFFFCFLEQLPKNIFHLCFFYCCCLDGVLIGSFFLFDLR
jgi:hypothetical protein